MRVVLSHTDLPHAVIEADWPRVPSPGDVIVWELAGILQTGTVDHVEWFASDTRDTPVQVGLSLRGVRLREPLS